jgi:methyltransferase (TIGR00027 family)
MRVGRTSFTASAVSAARGIAGVDPIAASLADGPLAALIRLASWPGVRRVVNTAALGLVDHAELRTLALDAVVRDAVAGGARQLVVLGAGLDARAWRMPELGDATVFEVDHPSTQAYKRPRIAARRATARDVRFIAIDFERDRLDDVLARAGHDATAATAWLWEGVTPYIARDATRSTLAAVARRSAAGSRVAVTYATPAASPTGPTVVGLAKLGFRAIGEPLRGLIAEPDMRRELGDVGFRVIDDTSATDWAARHGGSRHRILLVDERLAVATRG